MPRHRTRGLVALTTVLPEALPMSTTCAQAPAQPASARADIRTLSTRFDSPAAPAA
jgi:hypothetical protein